MTAQEEFQRLYDDHAEYQARRDQSSFFAKSILQEATEYKVPHLLGVLPGDTTLSSVIEIGCGTGEVLHAFPDQCPNSGVPIKKFGFDISPLNVAAARKRYPRIEFLEEDFRASEVRADAVILSDVLEHVPDDVDFLAAASRLAKVVLINLPLEDNWLNRNRQYGIDDPSGHLRAYSLQDGLDLVHAAGLTIEKWNRVWAHETDYDLNRRQLRRDELGHAHAGSAPTRVAKALIYHSARFIGPFGRKLFPANLFASAHP